nr:hypothetical protein [Tanacetum cinerariifolium]
SVDIDEGIELVDDQEKDDQEKDAQVIPAAEPFVAAVSTPISAVKPKVIPAAEPFVAAVSTPISAVKPKVLKIVPAFPTVSTRKRKGVVIIDPEEELHDDTPAETQSAKDKGKCIIEEEESLAEAKDAQATDVQPKYDYLKNTEGFKLAFFKGKTYDQIRPIFHARFDANMRFLLKSKEEMKKEEEEIIKTDEDDDVFVKATPIGTKVPVVNYEGRSGGFMENCKRFSTSKPTNFTDDYLLVTLKNMFEKTDAQDVIWRSQQTEHGQALVKSWKLLTSCGVHIITFTTTMFVLLVEKKYLLSRFTLEQLVNMARLQVEKESEMSLELLRFTRQQLLEYQQE